MIAHWDDVAEQDVRVGDIGGPRQYLGDAAGSVGVGANRVRIPPGGRATAVHAHGSSEEIFFVLGGAGLLWQDGRTAQIAQHDCIVHLPRANEHTLIAGEDGLEYIAYGTRHETEFGWLPRAGVVRLGGAAVETVEAVHPWQLELDAGPLDIPEPGGRPENVCALADAPTAFGGIVRMLGAGAGSRRSGLNHVTLPAGESGAPAHCHSAEEEVFVVLDGSGTLLLHPRGGVGEPEEHALRRGHVVARPPGTGIAHAFRAGPDGLTYLAYGTREPSDLTFYPESRTVGLRGLGVSFELPG